MIDERRGNRMSADVMIQKTEQLGWRPNKNLVDYIQDLKKRSWK
jgi:UDP-glucose 4-epimerase